jgi:hypothetical protein
VKARTALWERLDDAINPVLLKELRQAVRGRFVISALVISLFAESVTVAGMYVIGRLSSFRLDSAPLGPQTFSSLFGVIFFACMLLVPLYCGLRMAAERADTSSDLMYITTIAPLTIVMGKVLSVGAFAALLFGGAAPFLAFAFVLRGLDLMPCLLALVIGFLVILTEAALALFIGALPITRAFKAVLGLMIVGSAFLFSIGGMSMLMAGIRFGASGPSSSPPGFLGAFLSFALTIGTIAVVLIVLTTALLTPPAANRALPIRVMLTVLWGVTLYFGISAAVTTRLGAPLLWWAWTQIATAGLVLFSAVGERETWGKRIARTIPRSQFGRVVAFLFYSGAAGGILWVAMMLGATVGVVAIVGKWIASVSSRSFDLPRVLLDLESGSAAILAYGLTAVAIHRRFLARRILQKHTWTIMAVLLVIFAVIVPLAATLRYLETPKFQRTFEWAIAANPFASVEASWVAMIRLLGLAVWLIIVSALTRRWLVGQWERFKRDERPLSAVAPAAPIEKPLPALEELVSE